jgi:hypothetical protein
MLLILVTSGCINGGSTDDELPNRGLVMDDFSISDSELRTGQEANLIAKFTNYHTSIRNLEMSVVNTGSLEVQDRSCSPGLSELENATRGYTPQIKCIWTVEAPDENVLEGFNSMNQPVQLIVSYKGSLKNKRSFNVQFKESDEIESTQTISKSFSNGEIGADILVDSPVNADSGTVLEINLGNEGDGEVGESYEIEYNPSNLFSSNCPVNPEPVEESSWSGTCLLKGSPGSKSLFFTIHYKYTQTEQLGITIVNRQ